MKLTCDNFWVRVWACSLSLLVLNTSLRAQDAKQLPVRIETKQKKVHVFVGKDLFTTFDPVSFDKPILFPVYAPGQTPMTRNWPMVKTVAGEAHDHPHHKSMWFSHELNGTDFWTEKGGTVTTQNIETSFDDASITNAMRTTSAWKKKTDQSLVLTDQTTYQFGGDATSRWIDCSIEFRASAGDLHFEDTKEGLFAIRTHPDLRVTANQREGVIEVFGKALNSQGVTGKQVWGKPAKWMLYQGKIEGAPVAIAIYDHPNNLRHPATWHARDYGLVAANPFGMHHFLGKKKGTGSYTVKQGESLNLRYRVEFFRGQVDAQIVENKWNAFSKLSAPKLESK